MIASISTNFCVNQIPLKCYDSAKIVVFQGSFIIDTNNEDYKNSEQLGIVFPSIVTIRNNKPTSAFIICHKDYLQSGTIIKAQIQDNKQIIEKLPIYDGQGTVKIILASGFESDANESLLSPASSSKITMSAKDYNYPASIAEYVDCIQDGWRMLYVLMSSWGYAPGVENEYNITGLPSDLCIDVPVLTIDYHKVALFIISLSCIF